VLGLAVPGAQLSQEPMAMVALLEVIAMLTVLLILTSHLMVVVVVVGVQKMIM
jgi:hypothetical protein